jgi:hypothetical protein
MALPRRHANELLPAARGHAPVWAETNLGTQALAPIRDALDDMLTRQAPFPAGPATTLRPATSRTRNEWVLPE